MFYLCRLCINSRYCSQTLKSPGGDIWRRICQATLRSIALTASRIIPREVPYFLIAFHERDRVRILSCTRQEDAQDVYNQISQQWSKVLMSVPDNKVQPSHLDEATQYIHLYCSLDIRLAWRCTMGQALYGRIACHSPPFDDSLAKRCKYTAHGQNVRFYHGWFTLVAASSR